MIKINCSIVCFFKVLLLVLVLICFLLMVLVVDSVVGQFIEWVGDSMVSCSMIFCDLGFIQLVVLSGQESQCEIYLLVFVGVEICEVQLQFDVCYVCGYIGCIFSLLLVDGDLVLVCLIIDVQGDVSQLIGIDGFVCFSGFVCFGVGWWFVVFDYQCVDQSVLVNVLWLLLDMCFSYCFDGCQIDIVVKVWGVLLVWVCLLVDGCVFGVESYDVVWCVGIVLENGGKCVDVVGLLVVGDMVDLCGLVILVSLVGIFVYVVFVDGSVIYWIGSLVEVGVLLLLVDGLFVLDVVVISDLLCVVVCVVLDVLVIEVVVVLFDVVVVFIQWCCVDMVGLEIVLGIVLVQVVMVGGCLILLVVVGVGVKVVGLLIEQWCVYVLGCLLQVEQVLLLQVDKDVVLFSCFGVMVGIQDIVMCGDCIVMFDLGVLFSEGCLFSEVVFDVFVVLNLVGQGVVVFIFFNDYLFGVKVLVNDGKL